MQPQSKLLLLTALVTGCCTQEHGLNSAANRQVQPSRMFLHVIKPPYYWVGDHSPASSLGVYPITINHRLTGSLSAQHSTITALFTTPSNQLYADITAAYATTTSRFSGPVMLDVPEISQLAGFSGAITEVVFVVSTDSQPSKFVALVTGPGFVPLSNDSLRRSRERAGIRYELPKPAEPLRRANRRQPPRSP